MVWRIKKQEEPKTEEIEEVDLEEPVDLEQEKQEIENRLKQLEQKQKEARLKTIPNIKPKEEGFNKQELIDIAEGNLQRTAQILEILRRS